MNLPGIITAVLLIVVPFFMAAHTDHVEDQNLGIDKDNKLPK